MPALSAPGGLAGLTVIKIPPETTSFVMGKLPVQAPVAVTVPESGNCPSALGVMDWVSVAVTVVAVPGTGRFVVKSITLRTPVYVPVAGANSAMEMAVVGIAQVPPTICQVPFE